MISKAPGDAASADAPAGFLVKAEGSEANSFTVLRKVEEGGGTKPLIIVDGVILSDGSSLEAIDPGDIASVEVVKGTTAQAQYGERARNGVILIKTKG